MAHVVSVNLQIALYLESTLRVYMELMCRAIAKVPTKFSALDKY
jgi:hypothetical protein